MKLLVVLPRFPYPLTKGDQLRAYYQLQYLAQHAEITLVCLTEEDILPEWKDHLSFIKELAIVPLSRVRIAFNLIKGLFNKRPFQVNYFEHPALKEIIQSYCSAIAFDVVYFQLPRVAPYQAYIGSIPCVLDYQDAFAIGLERRAERSNWWLKPLLKWEARRMKAYESYIFDTFDATTIISEQDQEAIFCENFRQIHIVRNGVDTSEYSPYTTTKHDSNKSFDLLFVGNMSYEPNINCVTWLSKEVIPSLLQDFPTLQFGVVGVEPSTQVKALASNHIKVVGAVPTLLEYYQQCKVFLAPLQIGTGLQNKLLQAMSMAKPCVTSDLCNMALHATNQEEIVIANTPELIIKEVKELLLSPNKQADIGRKARAFIEMYYSWNAHNLILINLLKAKADKQ